METGFIYGLSSTRDNVVRYIGATKRSLNIRLYHHHEDLKRYDSLKCQWMKSELADGFKISALEIDEVCLDEIKNAEVQYIKLFKSFGAKLVNSNRGGNGGDFIRSVIEKLASHRKGKPLPLEHYNNLKKAMTAKYGTLEERKLRPKKSRKKIISERSNKNRVINQFSLDGNFIKQWTSISEISSNLNLHRSCIIKCCNKYNKEKNYIKPQLTAGGFNWEYADQLLTNIN